MAYLTVFKRYELKYLLTPEKKAAVLLAIEPYMRLDKYGRTTVRNLYLDTDNFRLIRRSMEKPEYKEKIRIRSYSETLDDSTVFVELKKKYRKIVYKRRLALAESEAMDWIYGRAPCPCESQISREVDYFMQLYGNLRPSLFLSYEREAFYERDGGDFRVTFDENILARREEPDLRARIYGEELLPQGSTLMELKCSGGIPLWLVRVLSREKIYKTSFSKYGEAYKKIIFPKINLQGNKELSVYGQFI